MRGPLVVFYEMLHLWGLQQTSFAEERNEGVEVGVSLEVWVKDCQRGSEFGPFRVIVNWFVIGALVFCKKTDNVHESKS